MTAALWCVLGVLVGAMFGGVARIVRGIRGACELDRYEIRPIEGRPDLVFVLRGERGPEVAFTVDARVAYRLADDLTRAAIRQAPRKEGL